MNCRKLLITGATGALGPTVVNVLFNKGYRIRVFSLDPLRNASFPSEVEVIYGDITKEKMDTVLKGIDGVVHMAALLHINNPSPDMIPKYEEVNVAGTENVVRSSIVARVRRIVFFSTIAVYGNTEGRIADESSPTKPAGFYAKTKLRAEKIVLNAKNSDGHPIGTVLRFGSVYGPRVKGNYYYLLKAISKGMFIPIGKGGNRRSLVFENDVPQAVIRALEHESAPGNVYNVTDGNLYTVEQIIESIYAALGKKPPKMRLPVLPIHRLYALFEDGCNILGIRPRFGRWTLEKYTEDAAVNSKKIMTELGFVPYYDLKKGWQETVRQMSKIGII